jgi:hypothetical protein
MFINSPFEDIFSMYTCNRLVIVSIILCFFNRDNPLEFPLRNGNQRYSSSMKSKNQVFFGVARSMQKSKTPPTASVTRA